METQSGNFIQFAGIRFSTIMIGVFSAFLVNLIFMPPRYEKKLYLKIVHTTEEIIKWIRLSTRHDYDHQLLKTDIKVFKESIQSMEQLYTMYKEERSYFKKVKLEKSRKLVIYRQLNITAKKALDTLKRLHRFENELLQLPETFKQSIQDQLDSLIYHHEQVLLRFIGKIPTPPSNDKETNCINKKELFDFYLKHVRENDGHDNSHLYHSMQIIATIIDYGEQVEHLDTLITSFHIYHKNEVSVEVTD
jgi:uncharacterized membrane protein YgaE (UPF0421/DUF939 family)